MMRYEMTWFLLSFHDLGKHLWNKFPNVSLQKLSGTESQRTPDQASCDSSLSDPQV